jgi:hypothetical protein
MNQRNECHELMNICAADPSVLRRVRVQWRGALTAHAVERSVLLAVEPSATWREPRRHVGSILRKLQLSSRSEAAVYAATVSS